MESDNSEISVGSLLVLGLFVRVAVFFMIWVRLVWSDAHTRVTSAA